jgi:hypothetical protein
MKRINLNNYEAFWLDYLEGNLSPDDAAKFVLFAAEHPELDIDLEEELVNLQDNDSARLTTEEKIALKEYAELEVLVVAELDGALSDENNLASLKIKHPEQYATAKAAYAATKLSPVTVAYPAKRNLKQPLVIPMYVRVAVAASVIGFIALFLPWGSFNPPSVSGSEIGASTNTSPSPLAAFGMGTTVHSKSFDFSADTEHNTTAEYEHQFVAEETPTPVDTSSHPFTPLQESPQLIVVDTTGDSQDNDYDEQLVQDQDSAKINVPTPVILPEDDQDIAAVNTPKNLTVQEFIVEKVLKVEPKQEEPLIASIIDQKTDWNVNYDESESQEKKVTQFKLGKFEFYKSSKK